MSMAQHYYGSGQSNLVAYSVIVKLMSLAGITSDVQFTDGLDAAISRALARNEVQQEEEYDESLVQPGPE